MAIYRGPGGPGDAVNDATSEVLLALAAKDAAVAAQVAAEAAQTAAELAETNAETAETNAETAETNAETAATNAAASASAASTSATNAASSASAASTSATNASTSATNAASSASAASTSASNAASSASSASSSASTATTQATNASNSASAAATSATNAANSATAAATSATNAANSATAASTSASNAATSETNAAASASAASTSASNAASSASAASTSASNAASSASSASTSASNAASSASAASTSATNAANSATAAQNAQTAAETARDQTLTAYDNFDDRYLGAKASNPTLDNDGNALIAGALYFNSTDGAMRVYTGSVWVDAYAAGTSFLAKANNLSDLPDKALARDNLGVEIGVDVQAFDATILKSANIGVSVQAYDAQLADIAGLTPSDNNFIVGNGTNFVTESGSTARTSLGLGTIATQDANNVSITGGSISGITDLAVADGGTGSSTASGARTNLLAVGYTATTGSAIVPSGTTAQRDGSPLSGYFRFNSSVGKFEGYNGTAWGSVGGGATGGGSDEVFVENSLIVTTNYTLSTGKNAMSVGPITVNSGVTVTVPSGARWVIL